MLATSPAAAAILYPAPLPKIPTDATNPFPPSYFAICTVVKDQNADLREWLYYHHWLGAETIYLYDHNSSTPLSSTVGDWIRSGVVVYNMFAGHHKVGPKKAFRNTGQGFAFQDCLSRSRGRHQWLAFLDADEYLVLTGGDKRNISALLAEYDAFGGLAVNWRVFGSSGHVKRPDLPVLQAYTQSIPDANNNDNIHVKTIVNMRFPAKISSTPHTFKHLKGKYAVTEEFRPCPTPLCSPVSVKRIALHHYALKSEEEYRGKMARGGGSGSTKGMDFFNNLNRRAHGENFDGLTAYAACCSHLQRMRR